MPNVRQFLFFGFAILFITGCFSNVVWYGKSPDRTRAVSVEQGYKGQYVTIDGHIGEVFMGIGIDALTWSADNRRLAYPAQTAKGWTVVIEDVASVTSDPNKKKKRANYDGIGEIVFSEDGNHIAFAAEQRGRWVVVKDDEPGPSLEVLRSRTLRLSADGAHIAYAGEAAGHVVVIADGAKLGPYSSVGKLSLSAAGQVAFIARKTLTTEAKAGGPITRDAQADEVAMVVIGGTEHGPYEDVADLSFSATGNNVAWIARQDGQWQVFLNGAKGPPFQRISKVIWAKNAEKMAYAAGDLTGERVVLEGVSGADYEGVMPDSLSFDESGKHIVYAARKMGTWRAIVDEIESEPYEEVSVPVFIGASTAITFLARRGEACFIVADGHQGSVVNTASELSVSSNGQIFLFLTRMGAAFSVIHGAFDGFPCGDGRCTPKVIKTREHDVVVSGTLTFSDDGKVSAYLAGFALTRSLFLMIDGEPAASLDMDELMAGLVVAPDLAGALTGQSKHLTSWVRAEATLFSNRKKRHGKGSNGNGNGNGNGKKRNLQ